jgi:FSR family fosmidomycin resistance protein-like MFS transporter
LASGARLVPVVLNSPEVQPHIPVKLSALLLLSIGHFFIDLYSSGLGAFQPVLVDKLSLTLKQAGLLGGILIFFSSVTQPLYGYLSDRLHSRVFTVLSPAVAGIFICGLVLAPTYWFILPLVVLGGTGISAFHPQASASAAAAAGSGKARWMAVFITSGTLGLALGPTFFSAIMSNYGFERVIWACLPGIFVTILLFGALPKAPAPGTTLSRAIDWEPLRAVWKPMVVHYFLVFLRSVVQITFAALLPLYLHRERGYSVTEANYILSLYLTSGALGGFIGGHLADHFGGKAIIRFSMIGSVPFIALFFATTGPLSIVGLALGGLVLLFTIPVNVVMAQALAPSQAGTVSALMMGFSWGMAGLIFVPLTGWLSDTYSLHAALRALTIFPLIGFVLSLKLADSR